jgi:ribosomal protein L11 methyltransferase
VPYRIDLLDPPPDALDRLVELGALDVDAIRDGLAAIMPDGVAADVVASVLGVGVKVSSAHARDNGSVWLVSQRVVQVGRFQFGPSSDLPRPGVLRMVDGPAFGTGFHATTALCLEALDNEVRATAPARLLDVGTGSGILALAALAAGVPRVIGLDIDADAVRVAADNARLNQLASRLHLVRGGPEAVTGTWPLVLANVLAGPLIELAPTLARHVASRGRLILSGMRVSVSGDVERAYRHVGMRLVQTDARDGWSAVTLQASW